MGPKNLHLKTIIINFWDHIALMQYTCMCVHYDLNIEWLSLSYTAYIHICIYEALYVVYITCVQIMPGSDRMDQMLELKKIYSMVANYKTLRSLIGRIYLIDTACHADEINIYLQTTATLKLGYK